MVFTEIQKTVLEWNMEEFCKIPAKQELHEHWKTFKFTFSSNLFHVIFIEYLTLLENSTYHTALQWGAASELHRSNGSQSYDIPSALFPYKQIAVLAAFCFASKGPVT